MKPRADFCCLSKRCATPEGEATVYELPVDATHCPQGHKRLRRLFNAVAVSTGGRRPEPDWRLTSSSHLARSTALLQDGMDDAYRRRASAKDMPTLTAGARETTVRTARGEFALPSQADLAARMGLTGRSRPMPAQEQMKEIRKDRLSIPGVLATLRGHGIPTVAVGRPR